MGERIGRGLTLKRESEADLSLSLRRAHFNCDQNEESATLGEVPKRGYAQEGNVGSFNRAPRPECAHTNSQWEMYSCLGKVQRYGSAACRWCRLCPISQSMPAPKRALEMKCMNHILCASQYEQAVFRDPGLLRESHDRLLSE